MYNKKLSETNFKRFSYLRHIPNWHKTDEEFEEYYQFVLKGQDFQTLIEIQKLDHYMKNKSIQYSL